MDLERAMASPGRWHSLIRRLVTGFVCSLKLGRRLTVLSLTVVVATGVLVFARAASAQQPYFDVLHPFTDGVDGASPYAALIQATDGNFYGTAYDGGTAGVGTVFKMTPTGTLSVLHEFTGGTTEGANPAAALVQSTDGNLYGTTQEGGAFNVGTVFKVTTSGNLTTLHEFIGGADGASPEAALIQATDGNFYGTTSSGGTGGGGTVFKMTPSGTITILHAFTGGTTDGSNPVAALIQATDGNFYGTTQQGGAVNAGTVFRMTFGGTFEILHVFTGGTTDGAYPDAPLIQATDGNFYGTTSGGGGAPAHGTVFDSGLGTVFKMTPSAALTILHAFTGGDGAYPSAPLIQATDGNLYGTTHEGGASDEGTLFEMTPGGTVTVMHTFTGGNDGAHPDAALIQATDRNFYGTTRLGGAFGEGVVFLVSADTSGNMSFTADFDGDGKSDLVAYRPSNGTWYIRYSSSNYSLLNYMSYQWGEPGDIPLVADFDGDHKADLVAYRPSNGTWYIRYSSSNYSLSNWGSFEWGEPGDIPIAADFDGDGKTDLAAYRPSNGTWYIRYSSSNYSLSNWASFEWGAPGDIPLVADFDGDGKADLAVWRPSTGIWYILFSSSHYSTWAWYHWGLPGDVTTASDIDGDGKADLVVWRPSDGTWYVLLSINNYQYAISVQWGAADDAPIPADFDGDHKTDFVVWRPSNGTWYVLFSSCHYSCATSYLWGVVGDAPL
jgi:uncharacterized repeat protein (TIGR03803 family)